MKLSFTRPPLSENQRFGHWAQKAKLVRAVRSEAKLRAKHLKIGPLDGCTVELHYQPRDKRRRDADNLIPTLKALCDGLVDAGIVPDDTPDYMTKKMPKIHPAATGRAGHMWLEITEGLHA